MNSRAHPAEHVLEPGELQAAAEREHVPLTWTCGVIWDPERKTRGWVAA